MALAERKLRSNMIRDKKAPIFWLPFVDAPFYRTVFLIIFFWTVRPRSICEEVAPQPVSGPGTRSQVTARKSQLFGSGA